MIDIISIIIIIAVVGLILWLVQTYLPMDAGVKKFLQVAVIVILIFWLLSALGIWSGFGNIRLN